VLRLFPVFLLVACAPGPAHQPSVAQLSGTYNLTAQSLAFLNDQKHCRTDVSSSLELHNNGTVLVHNLPDCIIDGLGKSHGQLLQGSGTWEIEKRDSNYGVTLNIDHGNIPAGSYDASTMLISSRAPPFEIVVIIGDPDQNESVMYRRNGS
jgi:hypothetical protein